MPSRTIAERLDAGETLLLDGGTGSELQRRGVDVLKGATDRLKAWSATANVEYADVVQQVHQDYLRVGADIIHPGHKRLKELRLGEFVLVLDFPTVPCVEVAQGVRLRQCAEFQLVVCHLSALLFVRVVSPRLHQVTAAVE